MKFLDWRIKFPVSSSSATAPSPPVVTLFTVVQRIRPLESDKTRSELLVRTNFPDKPPLIGLSRLATQTYVRSGMSWYHIPTYGFAVELSREKKPRANTPPFETSSSPGKSGFAGVRRSSDLQKQINNKRIQGGVESC